MPYSFRSNFSWSDYLKLNAMKEVGDEVKQLRYEISSSNRELIATYEELSQEYITSLDSIYDAITYGFELLSLDLQNILRGIKELTSVFEWGFSELLVSIGHMNDSFKELIKIAKTPAQTWAYEQFDISRDAFRKGLYEEALEYCNRSIEGHGSNTGYKLEYRFHFLLGTIRLGSFQNHLSAVINLNEAEKAFLNAAKYAKFDQPDEAGKAFLAAGWAAYCQGKISDAEEFTQQAISLLPGLGETYFQLAKILMHRNDPQSAIHPLKKAIKFDRKYALKASSDNDFKSHNEHVGNLVKQMRKEIKEKVENFLAILEKELLHLDGLQVQEFKLINNVDMNPLRGEIDNIKKAMANDTYYGYLDAMLVCKSAKVFISETRQVAFKSLFNELDNKLSGVDSEIIKILNFAFSDVQKKMSKIISKTNSNKNAKIKFFRILNLKPKQIHLEKIGSRLEMLRKYYREAITENDVQGIFDNTTEDTFLSLKQEQSHLKKVEQELEALKRKVDIQVWTIEQSKEVSEEDLEILSSCTKVIRDLLQTIEGAEIILKVAKENKLNKRSVFILVQLIELLIMNSINQDEFINAVKTDINIDSKIANKISQELINKIIKPLHPRNTDKELRHPLF